MLRLATALVAAALVLLALPAAAGPVTGRLTGRVLDGQGRPVPRFTVNDVAFEGGAFDVPLHVGDHRLVFRAPGRAPIVVAVHATARGTPGRHFVLPDLAVGAGATLIGAVVDAATGKPIAAAHAALGGPEDLEAAGARPERLSEPGVTDPGGAFLLRNAARGRSLLVVSHPDYLPAAVPVSTGAPLPTVRLHRGGTIAGVARDAAGNPIPFARVIAVSESARDAQEGRADKKGAFRLKKLLPGRYTVLASGAMAGTAALEEAVVRDGKTTQVELAVARPSPARLASAR